MLSGFFGRGLVYFLSWVSGGLGAISPSPFSLLFLFFFSPEMSGTGEDISQVHWKQQWLENGTLYFHVSMTESELLAQTTQAAPREPAHVLHEHMHLLHISVMVSFLTVCFFSWF